MKSRIYKSITLCIVPVMLAAICAGCGKKPEKSEPTQPIVQPTTQTTQATQPALTPAEKAMAMYAELLETYPTIVPDHIETLDDRTLGYDENLSQFGMHYDFFSIADLDLDGVPELISSTVINTAWAPVSVFEYNEFENQLYLLKDPLDPQSHATFEQMSTAGGTYNLYVCKNGHLHSNWGGDTPVGYQEDDYAYVLTDDGLVVVDCAYGGFRGNAENITAALSNINDEAGRASVFGSEK